MKFQVLETTNLSNFSTIDDELLKHICALFFEFEEVIKELSGDKRTTLYQVIPLRRYLINKCQIETDDHPVLQKLKVFLDKVT